MHRALRALAACAAALTLALAAAVPAGAVPGEINIFNEFAVPTPASQPSGIALGADNNLWFTERAGNKIGRITPDGDILEFEIPTPNSQPKPITLGPDGNMWFVELNGSKIGRITPLGEITEFYYQETGMPALPDSDIVAAGGKIWFTMPDRGRIGFMDPMLPAFQAYDVGGNPTAIAASGNCCLQFTDPAANTLRYMSTAGNVYAQTEMRTANSGLSDLSVVSDSYNPATTSGTFVLERGANKIGFTQGAKPTEYALPTPNAGATSLVLGRDGAEWFTESSANKLGRLNSLRGGASFSEFTIPTPNSEPEGLAATPEGIWFTEKAGNKVGRLRVIYPPRPGTSGAPGTDWGLGEPFGRNGCANPKVTFGAVKALASCFNKQGNKWVAEGRVRLGGIDLVPGSGDAIVLDPGALTVTSSKQVEIRAGSISFARATLNWNFRGSVTFPISGLTKLKGFLIQGDATVALTTTGANITVNVKLPVILGVSGAVTLKTNNTDGLRIDALTVSAPAALLGPLLVRNLKLTWSGGENWSGEALLSFPLQSDLQVSGKFAIYNGQFSSANGELAGINKPFFHPAIFLQKLRLLVANYPKFAIGGGLSVSTGAKILGRALANADGDFKYTSGSPSSFALTGAVNLFELDLGAKAQATYWTSGALDVSGNVNFTKAGFGISGSGSGFVEGDRFNLEANTNLIAFNTSIAGATALISSRGIAACGAVYYWLSTWRPGFGYYWGGSFTPFFDSCDVGPWRVTRAVARSAATAQQFDIAPGLPGVVFGAIGRDAAPRVTVTGPNGETITTPDASTPVAGGRTFLVVQDQANRTTYVLIPSPAAGTWKVAPQEGSTPLVEVRQANGLPPPSVRARVSGSGYARRLTWTVTARAGQRVRFIERGRGGATATLAVSPAARGSVAFTPADGPAGKRSIFAVVEQNGLPRRTLQVATYSAPAARRPARPPGLTALRRGSQLRVSWGRTRGAARYVVKVSLTDGRELLFFRGTRQRSVVVGGFRRNRSAAVTVYGVSASDRRGPSARAGVRALRGKRKGRCNGGAGGGLSRNAGGPDSDCTTSA